MRMQAAGTSDLKRIRATIDGKWGGGLAPGTRTSMP
jgi:hypothetical protein